jgi:hypothetical protein
MASLICRPSAGLGSESPAVLFVPQFVEASIAVSVRSLIPVAQSKTWELSPNAGPAAEADDRGRFQFVEVSAHSAAAQTAIAA